MPYLTYEEYNDLGFNEIEQAEFERLEKRASDVLNSVTRDFYVFNELEIDIPFRREKFKKAVAAQIEYFHDMGATSSHGLNEPSTVQIGRTSMSNGVRGSQGTKEQQNSIVCPDVHMYLEGTSLLYRGIGVRL